MTKDPKKSSIKKPSHRKGAHSVYSNLTTKKRTRADAKSRQKAEFLATLPKSRVKRLFYRMHPKRFFKYWFSKQGALMALKITGLGLAVFIILILTIFAIFRKDLAIGPDELTKRVQSRTTKFYDRTGTVLLYELYKDQQLTFVKPDQISNNMKWATVSIEDRDFYKHGGFDVRGIVRSFVNNVSGGGKQGASTITQQLARNVILEDNTRSGLAGYTRKLKEIILSVELERTYSKDEILNFYLNSIGYGGTAYGVESAAQRYFGKSAKDLNIEEAAYIASIPQYPSLYDRNSPSFDAQATLNRQHTVIDYMHDQGYITKKQADDAKAVDILTQIRPLTNDATAKKAPHFVDTIIKQLEGKYGADNVRKGGWTITTTLDWNMQQLAEKAVSDNINNVVKRNGDNAAAVAIDVPTNQVLALVGSRDYNYPGFGESNAATANLQPGSSLKPFVYSKLFDDGQYGAGSVLSDVKTCWGNYCPNDFDNSFKGNITIRSSLAQSRNIPAVKAAEKVGMANVIDVAKRSGETNIGCGDDNTCSSLGLSIGSGTVELDQHTAAYATIARGYVAKPEAYILKIQKPDGEIVQQWKDSPGTNVFKDANRGAQISYIVSDILADDRARSPTFGSGVSWFNPRGIKIAVKTGSTDNYKDGWMMGYSPKLAVGVWVGNADGHAMGSFTDLSTGPIFGQLVRDGHNQVMSKPEYGWTTNQWFTQPSGIQKLTVGGRTDLFQSWYQKPKESTKDYVMDRISKLLATSCTPEAAKETIHVTVVSNPRAAPNTQSTVSSVPAGYDINREDDVHQCGDPQPIASVSTAQNAGKTYTLSATVTPGKSPIQTVEFIVNGQVVNSQNAAGTSYSTQYTFPDSGSYTVQVRATDQLYYQTTSQQVTLVP